jgi:hypothetical protein
MIFDRAVTSLVDCFLLGDVAFGGLGLQVLIWWCFCCCYKDWNTNAQIFSFLVFLAVCIRTTILHCCRG